MLNEKRFVRIFAILNFDDNYREECHTTLGRFDREMSKRAWGNEEPQAPSIHREHGWHLPNDDD